MLHWGTGLPLTRDEPLVPGLGGVERFDSCGSSLNWGGLTCRMPIGDYAPSLPPLWTLDKHSIKQIREFVSEAVRSMQQRNSIHHSNTHVLFEVPISGSTPKVEGLPADMWTDCTSWRSLAQYGWVFFKNRTPLKPQKRGATMEEACIHMASVACVSMADPFPRWERSPVTCVHSHVNTRCIHRRV